MEIFLSTSFFKKRCATPLHITVLEKTHTFVVAGFRTALERLPEIQPRNFRETGPMTSLLGAGHDWEVYKERRIANPTQNPSPTSRLGDIGYVDESGTWIRVINILDPKQIGIEAIPLPRETAEYITKREMAGLVVELNDESSCREFATGDALASYSPIGRVA